MTISIVTPCYNSIKTIKKTLDSISSQKRPIDEHIIIDGGSVDRTLELLEVYRDNADYPVKIVSEPDNGIYDAMNKGIKMVSGDLIGILNSDDWYEPDTVENICNARKGSEHEIIYGMIGIYRDDKLKSMEFYHHDFLMERMINHPGCFVSRATYEDIGLFDLSYRSSGDYEWMKRAMDHSVTFTPVYKLLANVSVGGMSMSNVGFRETLKLQHDWGQVSTARYMAYSFKSHVGDLYRKIKR